MHRWMLVLSTALAAAVADSPAISAEGPPPRFETLLVLDRESVAAAEGVTFHLNQARKHPENPLLLPGAPPDWDSLQVIWPGTVLYDAQERLFRCWYSGTTAVQADRRGPSVWRQGYAESKDGVYWTKRGQIQADWDYFTLSLVFRNPIHSDPARKFLALFTATDVGNGRMGKFLASSAHGIRWRREKSAYTASAPGRETLQDISQLLLLPVPQDSEVRVLGYGQLLDRGKRTIGTVQGPDVGNLRDVSLTPVLAPEQGIDEEIHFASVSRVGGTLLMLFESDRFSKNHGDLRLAVSGDGMHWRRVHPQTPLVSTGPKGTWDENLLATTTAAMQEVGDEVWIYYFGCPNVFVNWPRGGAHRGSLYYPSYLGVAILPRDRYAYAAGPGSLTTHLLKPAPSGLWLNADGKEIRVLARDETGRVLAEGRVGNERSATVYRRIMWNGDAPSGKVRIQVHLGPDQRLYSLRDVARN